MSVLSHLTPQPMFDFFEQMCAIPHGSGNTKAISDWCVEFAKARNLRWRQDEHNNVVIWKDGTPGYENAPAVILQGHLDMVCAKDEQCKKDMAVEGLDLFIDGDLIGARGTSLGGDDGIAVAMALAILDSKDIPHPPLEAVFTIDEEVGLVGADKFDAFDLNGRYFLNIDSEVEGILTVSCAGGSRNTVTLPLVREFFAGEVMRLSVSGLLGGHSGQEIDKGRANAITLLGRALRRVQMASDLRLIGVEGGEKANVIPRVAYADLVVSDVAAAKAALDVLAEEVRNEFRLTDPDILLALDEARFDELPMDAASTDRTICLLYCAPNGVVAMSADIPGLVQTSLNLGTCTTSGETVTADFSVRSSLQSERDLVKDRIHCFAAGIGASALATNEYPAWEYRADSPLRNLMIDVYREQYGKEPEVAALHAGLECGIFSGKIDDLDCVSYGPDLLDIHTAKERMSISSTQRVYDYTLEVLKRLH